MSENIYMHTINNRPAMYMPGQQIVYINQHSRGLTVANMFADSLEQIRKEQKASIEWRKQGGFYEEGEESKYMYIRIKRRDYKVAPEKDAVL